MARGTSKGVISKEASATKVKPGRLLAEICSQGRADSSVNEQVSHSKAQYVARSYDCCCFTIMSRILTIGPDILNRGKLHSQQTKTA